MIIVSPSTIRNAHALKTRSIPKRVLGRITIVPKSRLAAGTWLRLIFEVQVLRYVLPLIPFVVAMLVWPTLALPISQAPILMIMAVAFVEMRVLAIKREDRDTLISDAEMARCLDALRFNATALLVRLAARRGLSTGALFLVIEQSELARIAPLTLVSVQQREPAPQVLPLDAEEQQMIREDVFDESVTERKLHRIALRTGENLRSVTLDVASISAHARMSALLEKKARDAQPEPEEAS